MSNIIGSYSGSIKKEYVSVNLLYFLQMRKAKCPKKVMAMKMSKTEHTHDLFQKILIPTLTERLREFRGFSAQKFQFQNNNK